MKSSKNLDALQNTLNYRFQRCELLEHALRHASFSSKDNNERLEFLGDGILNACVGDLLYKHFPMYSEGHLTRLRALLVNKSYLAKLAKRMQLWQWVLLHQSAQKQRVSDKMLSNVVEAILGAIFLDSDYQTSFHLLYSWMKTDLEDFNKNLEPPKDPKTKLQEYAQKHNKKAPKYRVLCSEGPPHQPIFTVGCFFLNLSACCEGSSIQIAQQQAACLIFLLYSV